MHKNQKREREGRGQGHWLNKRKNGQDWFIEATMIDVASNKKWRGQTQKIDINLWKMIDFLKFSTNTCTYSRGSFWISCSQLVSGFSLISRPLSPSEISPLSLEGIKPSANNLKGFGHFRSNYRISLHVVTRLIPHGGASGGTCLSI